LSLVKNVVKEESYSANSREYKKYLKVLEIQPDLKLYSEEATEFSSIENLLEENFIVASNNYKFVATERASGA